MAQEIGATRQGSRPALLWALVGALVVVAAVVVVLVLTSGQTIDPFAD